MSLADYSPHLAIVLERRVSSSSYSQIEAAMELVMNHGGANELDFERKPGTRYNPRPARVAVILIENAAVRNPASITAALITCVLTLDSSFHGTGFQESVVQLAQFACKPPAELLSLGTRIPDDVASIALAVWLDRIRHFHQATPERKQAVQQMLFQNTELYLELAKQTASPLYLFLSSAKEHLERRAKEQVDD